MGEVEVLQKTMASLSRGEGAI